MFVSLAFASTAGPSFPGTASGWVNSTNVFASDSVYATTTITATADSSVLNTSNYGFAIPAGATINGITVTVIAKAASAAVVDFADNNGLSNFGFELTKVANTGIPATATADGTTLNTTNTTLIEGSAASLWGTTWAPADINSTGFGVIMKAENTSASSVVASIDSVTITVTFTPAATGCKSCFLQLFSKRKKQTQTRSL